MNRPSRDAALEVLREAFGHRAFRGNQAAIIEHVLAGGDALAIMPTGGGKSLCYQIPALVLAEQERSSDAANAAPAPLTLVLSPLVALMKDQVDALQRRGIAATYINSSLSRDERERRYAAISAGHFDLLYVTPERFRKRAFVEVLDRRRVVLLAVDEAHCISEWGHDFRPDYSRVGDLRTRMGNPRTIALTATATPEVQADIFRQLHFQDRAARTFHEGIERPNLHLDVVEVWGEEEKLDQILALRHHHPGAGIVYFTLIRTLAEFSERLREQRVRHLVYHGDLSRRERRAVQDHFMLEPDHLVLATNAFGMGIDKEDIRLVAHAEVPGSIESYYQEIGRAGRDGRPSQCTLLYDQHDLVTQMRFLEWSNPDPEFYQRVYDFLSHDAEQVAAFGLEWLRERLHAKQRHDRRLETALAMLERYGAIAGSLDPLRARVVGPLPPRLVDAEHAEVKRRRDQEKLFALVEYVRETEDRKAFLHRYFGLPMERAAQH